MEDIVHPLHLFEGYGVELEYMIVHRDTLSVFPFCDRVIYSVVGDYLSEIELGEIAWSNELMLHVIELKTNGPSRSLENLYLHFQKHIKRINDILSPFDAMLLPTGAHPWMDPFSEATIWPHEYNAVYNAYNRIFDCRGHGWANLQSTHLNLPFGNDEEFGKLHAAIRLVLPLLPGLCASTPVLEGKPTGFLDTRLEYYRKNQEKISSITGKVIPEREFTRKDYEENILHDIYRQIAPFDVEDILQYEWLNSRGAIARFDRNTIEIRIMDLQECPLGDLAIISLVDAVLKSLVGEKWVKIDRLMQFDEDNLSEIFLDALKNGEKAAVSDQEFLKVFGIFKTSATINEIWQHLRGNCLVEEFPEVSGALDIILGSGSLSTRILKDLNGDYSHESLKKTYRRLAICLENGRLFKPGQNSE